MQYITDMHACTRSHYCSFSLSGVFSTLTADYATIGQVLRLYTFHISNGGPLVFIWGSAILCRHKFPTSLTNSALGSSLKGHPNLRTFAATRFFSFTFLFFFSITFIVYLCWSVWLLQFNNTLCSCLHSAIYWIFQAYWFSLFFSFF